MVFEHTPSLRATCDTENIGLYFNRYLINVQNWPSSLKLFANRDSQSYITSIAEVDEADTWDA